MALETIWQDVRYGLRGLLRNPGFSATAILSLVLGIGASLAILTVVDNLLLRSLPYRDPSRLMLVWERNMRLAGMDHNVVSPGNYFDWKRQNDVFQSMAGLRAGSSVLTVGSRSEQLEKLDDHIKDTVARIGTFPALINVLRTRRESTPADTGSTASAFERVLRNGERLRIGGEVDTATLRMVLEACG
jgi:hypothetical protein